MDLPPAAEDIRARPESPHPAEKFVPMSRHTGARPPAPRRIAGLDSIFR
ncbi:MAG: hypothetical protein HSCHL_1585 [Hydrogenibacillus schlegelii]|uniref:Uncharacterized protein n=1 Tax=Hydrogenibacillus schlegelii TaxID=1484 RepID=A0A2T5GBW2_HYDSH|nr:MAG: hypothetical protein HSCHL_1585 [Hydrogenibacillus schlegelii]